MFDDFYDVIPILFSWRWPKPEGEITQIDLRTETYGRGGNRLRIAIVYEF